MGNETVVIAVIQLVLTLTAATVAILPALLKMRSEKEKAEADKDATLTGSAMSMVEAWEKRVQRLEDKVADLEQSEDYWKRGCYRLINQLTSLGIQPCWDPNGGPITQPSEQGDTYDES